MALGVVPYGWSEREIQLALRSASRWLILTALGGVVWDVPGVSQANTVGHLRVLIEPFIAEWAYIGIETLRKTSAGLVSRFRLHDFVHIPTEECIKMNDSRRRYVGRTYTEL